jgi:uncharacterized protein YbjT (DUF2867 family)
VELVEAQLDDEASLKHAFEGAYGVFGVTNYWEGADVMKEFHQGVHIAHAAKATDVKHLVWRYKQASSFCRPLLSTC